MTLSHRTCRSMSLNAQSRELNQVRRRNTERQKPSERRPRKQLPSGVRIRKWNVFGIWPALGVPSLHPNGERQRPGYAGNAEVGNRLMIEESRNFVNRRVGFQTAKYRADQTVVFVLGRTRFDEADRIPFIDEVLKFCEAPLQSGSGDTHSITKFNMADRSMRCREIRIVREALRAKHESTREPSTWPWRPHKPRCYSAVGKPKRGERRVDHL